MEFKDPWILFFIPVVIGFVVLWKKKHAEPSFQYSSISLFSSLNRTWKVLAARNLFIIRLLVLTCFFIALAGPREVLEKTEVTTEGVDIILAVDASGSMRAEDFKVKGNRVNRLSVVKDVVKDFIDQRNSDRMGLIAFAGQAYTVSPLTTDYDWLVSNLEMVNFDRIKEDGTAIGSAIMSSVGRLKDVEAKSKIVILLTDGVSKGDTIDPVTAANVASSLNIKVYTIGVGSKGLVPFPARDLFGRSVYRKVQINIDEKTLKEIARITDGKYYRAQDTESLKEIYDQIDQLEKTEIKETGYKEYKQLFPKVILCGIFLLFLELMLSNTLLLKIP